MGSPRLGRAASPDSGAGFTLRRYCSAGSRDRAGVRHEGHDPPFWSVSGSSGAFGTSSLGSSGFQVAHRSSVNITWRTLPEKFGHWNSMWKRFWRLSRSGTFEAFLRCPGGDERDGAFGADVRFHRGARPCLGSGRKRGQHDQALGRSRGSFSTKIHLKTDFGGLPIAFHLTGGEAPRCTISRCATCRSGSNKKRPRPTATAQSLSGRPP